MKLKNHLLIGLLICLCAASVGFGQQLRGYAVGRYEGQALNANRNTVGKILMEVKNIDSATGAVIAHLQASEGLSGSGDLTGKIDNSGVLRLAGSIGEWKINLAGKVKADEIKANYRLTGATAQTGSFTVKLMEEEIAPPEDEELNTAPNDVKTVTHTTQTTTTKTVNQTADKTQIKAQDDDVEKSKYAKPDFSEMERWYDIQAYNYDVFNKQLIFMVKAKVESRPTDFKFEFLDADGVVVYSNQFWGLWHTDLVNKPEKFSVNTPTEIQMEKVKIVRVVRLKQ